MLAITRTTPVITAIRQPSGGVPSADRELSPKEATAVVTAIASIAANIAPNTVARYQRRRCNKPETSPSGRHASSPRQIAYQTPSLSTLVTIQEEVAR